MTTFQRMKHTEQCGTCNNLSLRLYATAKNPSIVVAKEICHCSPKHSNVLNGFFTPVEGQCPFCESHGVWWMHEKEKVMVSCADCTQIRIEDEWFALDSLHELHLSQKRGALSQTFFKIGSFFAKILNGIASVIKFIGLIPYHLYIAPMRDYNAFFPTEFCILLWAVTILGFVLTPIIWYTKSKNAEDRYNIAVLSSDQKNWYVYVEDDGDIYSLSRLKRMVPTNLNFYKIESTINTSFLSDCLVNQKIDIQDAEITYNPNFEAFNSIESKTLQNDFLTQRFSICTYKTLNNPNHTVINNNPVLLVRNYTNNCFNIQIGEGVVPTSCPQNPTLEEKN